MTKINVKIRKLRIVPHLILRAHCVLHAKTTNILDLMDRNVWNFVRVVIVMRLQHTNALMPKSQTVNIVKYLTQYFSAFNVLMAYY